MLSTILVTYATRYGSTEEVAHTIAESLREYEFDVYCQPLNKVKSIEEYDAVVLGAPIYIGKWHKAAHRFLTTHRDELVNRPLAIFSLGPLSEGEEALRGSRGQLDTELEQYSWLSPVAVEMFGGRYDPAKLGVFHKLLTGLPASPLPITGTGDTFAPGLTSWLLNYREK